jgi:hypothetical protein
LILEQAVAFNQVKLQSFYQELLSMSNGFGQKIDFFFKNEYVGKNEHTCFVERQRNIKILRFQEQLLLYKLIYK